MAEAWRESEREGSEEAGEPGFPRARPRRIRIWGEVHPLGIQVPSEKGTWTLQTYIAVNHLLRRYTWIPKDLKTAGPSLFGIENEPYKVEYIGVDWSFKSNTSDRKLPEWCRKETTSQAPPACSE